MTRPCICAAFLAAAVALVRPPAAHGAPSLADELRHAGGPNLLLVQKGKAIVARTPDGRFERRIVEGTATAYDPARELLWFHREDSLLVLDLRRASPEPIRIVERLGGMRIAVHVPQDPARSFTGGVRLVWSRRPRVEPYPASEEYAAVVGLTEEQEQSANASMKERARHARLVGRAWLANNHARRLRPVRRSRFGLRLHGFRGGDCSRYDGFIPCSKGDARGRAAAFPWRGIRIVAVGYECDHDGCILICNLHDRVRQRWALTTHPSDWASGPQDSAGMGSPCDVTTSADSTMYIAGERVCRAETGCAPLAPDEYVYVLGWLDPGIRFVAP